MEFMTPLRILIAENNPGDGELLEKNIHSKIGKLLSVELEVCIVTTLREAITLAPTANATILDLHLDDAEPEQVREAIREKKFRAPVIVVTGDDDPKVHAECYLAGADVVFLKAHLRRLYDAILQALARDIRSTPILENASEPHP